mgnify:CR=1 FL=1
MLNKYLLLLFVFIPIVNHAQSVKVVDSENGNPLPNVSVFNQNVSVAEVTNQQGTFELSPFKNGRVIVFSYLGYNRKTLTYEAIIQSNNLVELEPRSLSMDDVVVSANRWEQSSQQLPLTVSKIEQEQVNLQNPQTAADLLKVSGNVFVQKSQLGGGSPMLRGFATNRVLLVVDGVRMNNAIFRGGNLQNVISLDPNSIAQTEVVLGPGSVTYGSDAIGGVMSFSTLQPSYSLQEGISVTGNGMVRASSANEERTAHFDLTVGLKKWAFLSSVSLTDYDAQRMGSSGPNEFFRRERVVRVDGQDLVQSTNDKKDQVPTGFSQINAMQKFRFRPTAQWELNLDLHYSTTGDIPRYDRLIERLDNGQFRKAEWFYGPQQWFLGNFSTSLIAEKKLFDKMKTSAAFQTYEESRNDRNFGKPNLRNRQEQLDIFSVNIDFEKVLTQHGTLYYGVESVFNWIDSKAKQTNIETGQSTPVQTRYPDGSKWRSNAAFFNYQHTISPDLTLQGGARFNHISIDAPFSDQFFDFPFDEAELNSGAFTGSIGAVYTPDENWRLNANMSTAFRAPNIDDIGKIFDSEPGSVVVPNPRLSSEYAWNIELGIERRFRDKLQLDIAAFYTKLDDALVRRDFTLNGQDSVVFDGTLSQVQAIQNASEAWVWGIQGGFEWQIAPSLNLSSHINFQEGEEQDDDGNSFPLRHVAPLFGTTHLTYSPGEQTFTVDAYVDYNGKIPFRELAPSERGKPHLYAIDENGNPFSPAWYTINLKASYQITESTQITAGLENMTDQLYRTYSSGIAAPGINGVAAIRTSF